MPSKEKQDPDLMNTLLRLFPRKETKEGSIIIKVHEKEYIGNSGMRVPLLRVVALAAAAAVALAGAASRSRRR